MFYVTTGRKFSTKTNIEYYNATCYLLEQSRDDNLIGMVLPIMSQGLD